MPEGERKLAAIMFTDVLGYTALAQADEQRTLELLKKHRGTARDAFARHGGRVVKTTGDGFIVEFASALSATQCAVDLQSSSEREGLAGGEGLKVRVGIHVGDVVHEEEDVFGDAVNIASRIQTLAEGGGICLSQQAYDQVRNKVPFGFSRLETPEMKNVAVPIDVYRLELHGKGRPANLLEADSHRLAVLPFANMSSDPNDEYFADGMTEELISTLSQIQGIDVISRTSVMQYKKNPKPLKDVLRELGSGTVLEGSVRKDGNMLRVTVQMVDARRDRHLWAESYDRELKDVFGIQTGIARQVADALRVQMRPGVGEGPTPDVKAYTEYLKGRYYWNRRGLEDVRKALTCCESAVKEDPKFALGYVGLADCHHVLATRFEMDVDANRRATKEMVARALELDPDLAEAHASKGVALLLDFNLRGAEAELRKATESKPSYASAHQWYAQLLIGEQRWEEARAHIEKAAELDPFSESVCLVHTYFYDAKREYAAGLEYARRAAELNPDDPSSHIELAWLLGKLKMFDGAREEAKLGVRLAERYAPFAGKGVEAMLAYLEEDRRRVKELLPELKAHIGETATVIRFIADLHFYLGEADEGFRWMEKSWAEREFDLIYLKSDEFLDGFRGDPRYEELLRRIGLR